MINHKIEKRRSTLKTILQKKVGIGKKMRLKG